jgi:hypothetical protein
MEEVEGVSIAAEFFAGWSAEPLDAGWNHAGKAIIQTHFSFYRQPHIETAYTRRSPLLFPPPFCDFLNRGGFTAEITEIGCFTDSREASLRYFADPFSLRMTFSAISRIPRGWKNVMIAVAPRRGKI